jgi:hypothetical protein
MFCSEQTNPLLYFDYLSPKPKLYIYSNKRFHTKIGAISSLILFLFYFILVIFFIVNFSNGNGMVVIYSKDTSDKNYNFNMTNHLFAFNLSGFNKGAIDPRALDMKVIFWRYRGSDRVSVELEYERCNFQRHFKDGKYDDVFKTLGVSNFYCLDTSSANVSLFYNPYEWAGSYIAIYLTMCINSTKNNDNCYSHEQIDQYLRNDNFFLSYVVDNIEIDHYNRSYPFKNVKYFNTIKINYISRVDLTMYWRPVEYLTDKGWIFDKLSTVTTFQLDETLSQQNYPSNEEKFVIPSTFSKIQFQLYYASIDKYQRTYPKMQTVIANISGIVQIMFYVSHFIVYSCSIGQYFGSFFNLFEANEKLKENDLSSNPLAHSITMCSNISEAQLKIDKDKTIPTNISSLSKDKKNLFKFQSSFFKNKNEMKEISKEISQKGFKTKRNYNVTCLQSFKWFFLFEKRKRKSPLSIVEQFVRENVSVETIINKIVFEHNQLLNLVMSYSSFVREKNKHLNKTLIPFSHNLILQNQLNNPNIKNNDITMSRKYITTQTVSEKKPKTNKTTSVGYKFSKYNN